jgi:hypothetical protein
MAEWSCSGLQSRGRRFDSDSRLQFSATSPDRPGGETGRHRGLKIPRPQGHGGSIPPLGTRLFALACLAIALALPQAANAQTVGGAFSQGRTHLFVGGGSGQDFSETYFVLSLGVSYYVIDGLGVGLAYERWTGADPGMYKITPSVQYVFQQLPLKPYLGAFYRRTSIENLPDLDSVGGRAGVYFQGGRNFHVGIGGVYESYLDCSKSTYRECDSLYPEVSFTFAF